MKTAIDMQSKNEVKELLNEYIVSPLNTDISKKITKIDETLNDIDNKADKLSKDSASIKDGIRCLPKKLSKLVDESLSDICDNLEELTSNVDDVSSVSSAINEKIDEFKIEFSKSSDSVVKKLSNIAENLEEIKSCIDDNSSKINDNIKKSKSEIKSDFSEKIKHVNLSIEEIGKITCQKNKEIIDELNTLSKMVDIKAVETFKAVNEKFDIISQEEKKNQSEFIKELNEVIDSLIESISVNFDYNGDKLKECVNDTTIKIDELETKVKKETQRKYGYLLKVAWSLGILNFLEVIAVIILLFANNIHIHY